jgi:hypothetical protein
MLPLLLVGLSTTVRWPIADKFIAPYAAEAPLAIGLSIRQVGDRVVYQSRSYLLLSTVLTGPTWVTVSQVNSESPLVSKGQFSGSILLTYVLVYLSGGLCVWWFWFRPRSHEPASLKP